MDIVYCNLKALLPCVFCTINSTDNNLTKTDDPKHPTNDEGVGVEIIESRASECLNNVEMGGSKEGYCSTIASTDGAKVRDKGIVNFVAY